MTALPSSAIVTGEYRALTIFEAVPMDCGGIFVPSNDFAPHLKRGEVILIDPDDNGPMGCRKHRAISYHLREGMVIGCNTPTSTLASNSGLALAVGAAPMSELA